MHIFLGFLCGSTAVRAYQSFKHRDNTMGIVLGIVSLLCGFFAGIFCMK